MFRWLALGVLLSCLLISGTLRRRARQATGTIARTQEPPLLIAGRLLVALPLFGGVFVWIAHPPTMAWATIALPTGVRWTGAALGVLCIPAVWWVLSTLGSNVSETVLTKDAHQLVTDGPYRYVRHPLYTTGVALFTSLGFMAASGFTLACTLVALVGIRVVVVPREEAALAERFGEAYIRYRARTGTMLPVPGREA